MKKSTAIFPGTFDPLTLGHTDIIDRSIPLFERLILAIGVNTRKTTYFNLDQRLQWLRDCYGSNSKVEITHYSGLTVDYCKQMGAGCIVRGIRGVMDFEYEKTIAQLNHSLLPEVETILMFSRPEYAHISSTVVREIIIGGGNHSQFIPEGIKL